MADAKISSLTTAATIAATTVVPVVRSGASATEKATIAQVAGVAVQDATAFAAAGTGAVARTVQAKLREVVSVDDYGAVGDGVTDDGPAFQRACDALGAGGGVVHMGPKPYRIATTVAPTNSIIWQGSGYLEGPSGSAAGSPTRPAGGTWLLHGSTLFPMFSLTTSSAQGTRFRDFAVWQDHPSIGTGWAPTAHNFVFIIDAVAGTVGFDNIHLHNIYTGISATDSGRLDITRLQGQVFYRGIVIDRAYDKCYLGHVDFWPYWSGNANVLAWTQANGVCFNPQKVDGFYLDNFFCLGYKLAIWFTTSASGQSTRWFMNNLYADFCERAIAIDSSSCTGYVNNLVALCEAWGTGTALTNGMPIAISGSNNRLHVGVLHAAQCAKNAANIGGTGNVVEIDQLQVDSYNTSNTGAVVISTAATNVVYLAHEPRLSSSFPTTLNGSTGLVVKNCPVNWNGAAVNYPAFGAGAAGGGVNLSMFGPDSNISFSVVAAGTGSVTLRNGSGIGATVTHSGTTSPRFSVDTNLYFTLSGGNPVVNFDANDYILYDRTNNKFFFTIGGATVASIDASGNMRLAGSLTQSTTP